MNKVLFVLLSNLCMKLSVLCYIQRNGKTLMLHRIKKEKDIHHGKWNGLGSKMEPNESPENAVEREVLEESGLVIEDPQLKGVITYPQTNNDEEWIVFVFTANKFTGKLIECNEGNLEWIKDSKVKDLYMWKGDYLFLPLLKKKGFFSGKITYDKENIVEAKFKKYC